MEHLEKQTLMRPEELAEFLKVSQKHLRALREEGMPFLKVSARIYRYPTSMIVNYFNSMGSWPREDDFTEEYIHDVLTANQVEQEATQ